MTDISEVHWYTNIFRWFFSSLDQIAYRLVAFVVDIFNIIAGTEIRTSGIINNFFSRIQIILGIIILFKLVISFFSGIVDPDGFTDGKKGFGSVIKRVVVVLVMILLIVPLNIPESEMADLTEKQENSQKTWNARMNESGILFGTLAELQSRVLKGEVITRLILGTGVEDEGDDIPLTLLKSFVHINLQPGTNDPKNSDNWLCPESKYENSDAEDEEAKKVVKILNGENVTLEMAKLKDEGGEVVSLFGSLAGIKLEETEVTEVTDTHTKNELKREMILDSINYKCDLISGGDGERYIFVYQYFLSTIAGVVAFALFLSLTIDVAVRVFKLLILRLISPVAILSYIDPKSEKTFNNWVKTLLSTYLDLFVRIAIISFTLLLITMIGNLLDWNTYVDDGIGILTIVFARLVLIFGLLVFAKQAPKFITETLGIDNKESGGLFSGFGKIMAGAGIGLGAVGSFRAGRRASIVADQNNEVNPKHWWTKAGNHGKHILSGITGAAGGVATGVNAAATAKDHYLKNTRQAISKRNADLLNNARSGGTAGGAAIEDLKTLFTGEDSYSRMEANWKASEQKIKDRQDALKTKQDALKISESNNAYRKNAMDRAASKAVDCEYTTGSYGNVKNANYRDFHSVYTAAMEQGVGVGNQYVDSSGKAISEARYNLLSDKDKRNYSVQQGFTYTNANNETYFVNMANAQSIDLGLKEANAADFYEKTVHYYRTGDGKEFSDAAILGDLQRYKDSTGRDMEYVYSGRDGLKAKFGENIIANNETRDNLSREVQALSAASEALNKERTSAKAQRAQANANRNKNSK